MDLQYIHVCYVEPLRLLMAICSHVVKSEMNIPGHIRLVHY